MNTYEKVDYILSSEERAIMHYGSSLREIVTNNLNKDINEFTAEQRPQRLIRRTNYQQAKSIKTGREIQSRPKQVKKNTSR